MHRETSTIPIVFTIVSDPVGAGFAASLPRPGGNMTGFTQTDPALGGKWLSLLKQAAPGLQRVATMFNPDTAPGQGKFFMASFEAAARSLAIEPVVLPVRSDAEIEARIAVLGRERSGLVMADNSFIAVHYRTVISATARNNVPAISFTTQFAKDGGLMSYQSSIIDQFRGAAGYVNRILHGEKAGDLPVQTPTKFELTINLKTATTLGLTISAVAARHRGRGDRIGAMSPIGTNAKSLNVRKLRRCWDNSRLLAKCPPLRGLTLAV